MIHKKQVLSMILGVALIGPTASSCRTAARIAGGATVPIRMAANSAEKGLKRSTKGRREARLKERQQKAAEKVAGDTKVLGGTIRLVREPLGFVLIESSGRRPPDGSQLYVHRSGAADPVAMLQVSPERKTGFVVADILSGRPAEGDLVMWSLPTQAPPVLEARPADPSTGQLEHPRPLSIEELRAPAPIEVPTFPPDADRGLDFGPRPEPPLHPAPLPPGDAEAELERELRGLPIDPEG